MGQKQRRGSLPPIPCHFCEKLVNGDKGLTDHLFEVHKLGIGNRRIRENMKGAANGKHPSQSQTNR